MQYALVNFKPLSILSVVLFDEYNQAKILADFSEKVKERVWELNFEVHQLNNGTLYQIVKLS